jgi:hypothetical protein
LLAAVALVAGGGVGYLGGHRDRPDPFESYRQFRVRVLRHQIGQPASGAWILVGSSTLERLNPGRLGVPVTPLAIGGDRIPDLLERVPGPDFLRGAHGVIVLAGYNDLEAGGTVADVIASYATLLSVLQPAPFVICSTIQKPSPAALARSTELAARIEALNDGIRRTCSDGSRRALFDLERALERAGSGSAARLYADDIHLSSAGYDVLVTGVRELMQSAST